MSTVSFQSATAYGYGQVQRQLAQNNAEQLEAKAQALAAAASQAREEADQAVRNADEVSTEAGTARNQANNASLAFAALERASTMKSTIAAQADLIYQALQANDERQDTYGSDGQSSASAYRAGTIFDLAG